MPTGRFNVAYSVKIHVLSIVRCSFWSRAIALIPENLLMCTIKRVGYLYECQYSIEYRGNWIWLRNKPNKVFFFSRTIYSSLVDMLKFSILLLVLCSVIRPKSTCLIKTVYIYRVAVVISHDINDIKMNRV